MMAVVNCNYATLTSTAISCERINIPVNAKFIRIASLKPQPHGTDNRMIFVWIGLDGIQREYFVNQNTLKKYVSESELKAALDQWTLLSFGYVINCVWFHINDDSTWAVAYGKYPPDVWPEDMVIS
jgi:hypothetical protein